jgi:hypothetical protein
MVNLQLVPHITALRQVEIHSDCHTFPCLALTCAAPCCLQASNHTAFFEVGTYTGWPVTGTAGMLRPGVSIIWSVQSCPGCST